jgi:periplasmic divalent cation tolerance protein
MKTPAGQQTRAIFAYITCVDEAQAERIARALLNERLAGCANLIPGMRSLYWWQGRLDESREVVLIAKTRANLLPALTHRVKSLHSYTVPCVCALPVVGGNEDYLRWLVAETVAPSGSARRREGATSRHPKPTTRRVRRPGG